MTDTGDSGNDTDSGGVGGDTTGGGDTGAEACQMLPPLGGVWQDDLQLDLRDPAPEGNDVLIDGCGWGESLEAHHCYITAVHAMHLHTGEMLLFHGKRDQRVLDLFGDAVPNDPSVEGVSWTPLPYRHEPTGDLRWVDLFCAGHAQLGDGSMLIAGGNISGDATDGGLRDVFRFESPGIDSAQALECPYFWELDELSEPSPVPWSNPHGVMVTVHPGWREQVRINTPRGIDEAAAA